MNMLVKERYYDYEERGREWIDVARELYLASLAKANWAKKEAELKEQLRTLSDNKNSIGGGFIFTCTERMGSVDYRSIPELKEIDLDLYRKTPVFSWSLKKV